MANVQYTENLTEEQLDAMAEVRLFGIKLLLLEWNGITRSQGSAPFKCSK